MLPIQLIIFCRWCRRTITHSIAKEWLENISTVDKGWLLRSQWKYLYTYNARVNLFTYFNYFILLSRNRPRNKSNGQEEPLTHFFTGHWQRRRRRAAPRLWFYVFAPANLLLFGRFYYYVDIDSTLVNGVSLYWLTANNRVCEWFRFLTTWAREGESINWYRWHSEGMDWNVGKGVNPVALRKWSADWGGINKSTGLINSLLNIFGYKHFGKRILNIIVVWMKALPIYAKKGKWLRNKNNLFFFVYSRRRMANYSKRREEPFICVQVKVLYSHSLDNK